MMTQGAPGTNALEDSPLKLATSASETSPGQSCP